MHGADVWVINDTFRLIRQVGKIGNLLSLKFARICIKAYTHTSKIAFDVGDNETKLNFCHPCHVFFLLRSWLALLHLTEYLRNLNFLIFYDLKYYYKFKLSCSKTITCNVFGIHMHMYICNANIYINTCRD